VKLLLDQNLSPRLASKLSTHFPETIHVREVGLQSADDQDVWDFAIEHGYVIVSKDSDFHQLAFLRGPPPKVIWIRLGNCTRSEIEALLQESAEQVRQFIANRESAFLIME
jgi:predicted nuclease of predicted toxin-antitoxin system